MSNTHYDVIIIGGRCAGASLALWLAGNDLKILLIDRATFPSAPNVPSAPHIHPGTMRLLDELGIDESEYANPHNKIENFATNMLDQFHVVMPMSRLMLDRNYFRGIDRCLFDEILWKHAIRGDGVVGRSGFSATQILKDNDGHVTGIMGKAQNGETETFTADLVVGADGRFSFAARQFGAQITEEQNTYTSAVYHAEWENVDDHSAETSNALSAYNTVDGFMTLVIPIAERKVIIGTAMKSEDAIFGARGTEQAYEQSLKQFPHLWNRLKNAQRTTKVVGIRSIENGYREAYGKHWALVGDAVHYKDPSDGQGIYDALLGSKLLAKAIIDWKRNNTSWESAGARYQQQFRDVTHPTFEQTVKNTKQTLYTKIPGFVAKTMVRWLMSDPDFQTHLLQYLSRAIDPADYKPGRHLSPKLIMRGIIGDFRTRFVKQQ